MVNRVYQYVFIVFLLIMTYNLTAQISYHNSLVLDKNKIESLKTYRFISNSDSILHSKEEFNKKGRVTEISIFDSVGFIRKRTSLIYHFDTLLHQVVFYKGDTVISSRYYHYDINGREIAYMVNRANGRATGSRGEKKYNKNGLLIEEKRYERNLILSHIKYYYFKNGNLKKVKVLEPQELRKVIQFEKEVKTLTSKEELKFQKSIPNFLYKVIHENGLIQEEYKLDENGQKKLIFKYFYQTRNTFK